jgi:hypothetical protein
MNKSLQYISVILGLFCIQLYILIRGISFLDKLEKPFVLLAVSVLIVYCYAVNMLKEEGAIATANTKGSPGRTISGWIIGLLSISALYGVFRKGFDEFADYRNMSDVITQLETLYDRFANGVFPYYPLEVYPWHPYPVYMPLNWFPVGLAKLLHCDVRWIGVLFLAIAASIWGGYSFRAQQNVIVKIVVLLLPAIAMFTFLHWNSISISVSYEVLIAAYYLVLATGLAAKSLPLTVIGIITCILSRYTMVFWLPVFLYMLWLNTPKKTSFIVWGSIVLSVLLLYAIPFYFKDPSILTRGLAYHNHCYIDAWNGLGNPEQSTAFDEGLNFSWFIREYTSGAMDHRVTIGRSIQLIIQLLVILSGIFLYRKWKDRVNFYDFALLVLFVQMLLFFMLSPQTYMYYYLPFMMVSAVLCGKVMLRSKV